jgi:hypothetical protein
MLKKLFWRGIGYVTAPIVPAVVIGAVALDVWWIIRHLVRR